MTPEHRTARNVALVSVASFVQIVIQFLFQRVLAGWYGASVEADALAAALALPTMFAAIVTGSLSYVLVPELVIKFSPTATSADARDGEPNRAEHAAWQLVSFVGLVTFAVSVGLSLLLFVFAQELCTALYGDLRKSELTLTSDLLQILSVQVVLNGLISWTQAVHHSRHRFAVPALAGVMGTALSLAIAFQLGNRSIDSLAWAINAGSALSAILQLIPLLSRLGWPQTDQASILKLCGLFGPLLLGATLMRVDPLIDRILAAKLAVVDPGAIAYVNYAQRILAALLAIGTSSLAVVAFPQLAQRMVGDGASGFADHFSLAFRRLILLVVPITIGFSCFSVWIIRDLLEHGAFTPQDSGIVGWLIIGLMGMFVGASCAELFARGYYALGDTRTPTIVGVVALVISWGFKLWLFSVIGIWGIALGVSVYCVLSASGMGWWLTLRFSRAIWSNSLNWFLQSFVSTVVACAFCYGVYRIVDSGTWLAAPVGAIVYFAVLLFLQNADAQQFWTVIRRRISG